MKFDYQLSHGELAKSLSLLGVPTVGAWLVYLVVASAMIPSIILFAAIGAGTCLAWFSVMLVSILISSAWAYWQRTGYPRPFPESMEFLDDSLVYRYGHSRVECRWNVIDRVEEFSDHVQICAHDRPWMLPKRVLGDRAADCLQFLQGVTSKANNSTEDRSVDLATRPPINLYRELIPMGITNCYRYRVSKLDLEQAIQEKFSFVSPVSAALTPPRKRETSTWLKVVKLCLLWFVLGSLVFLLSRLSDRPITMEKVVLISLGWFLPIVWLLAWRRFSWLFRTRLIKQKVPDIDSTLTLTASGWVIANPESGTFGHWLDLQGILQSENYIGLRMINQLVYLIPNRIFASPQEMDNFLDQSLKLQQSQLKADPSFQTISQPSPAIETRNPYQSPRK